MAWNTNDDLKKHVRCLANGLYLVKEYGMKKNCTWCTCARHVEDVLRRLQGTRFYITVPRLESKKHTDLLNLRLEIFEATRTGEIGMKRRWSHTPQCDASVGIMSGVSVMLFSEFTVCDSWPRHWSAGVHRITLQNIAIYPLNGYLAIVPDHNWQARQSQF